MTTSAATARFDHLVGFYFECSCGELYRTVEAAATCRKCRSYCVFGYCTHVTDIRSGAVVWGQEPDRFEYEAAEADALERWAEERRQLEWEQQMWAQEGELWDAEQEARRELEMLAAAEAIEDNLYDIQDALMGY